MLCENGNYADAFWPFSIHKHFYTCLHLPSIAQLLIQIYITTFIPFVMFVRVCVCICAGVCICACLNIVAKNSQAISCYLLCIAAH